VSACLTPAVPFPAFVPLGRRSAEQPASVATAPPWRPVTETRAGVEAEVAWIRRMAAGDGQALAALYDRHAPLVLGLLARMLGERGEAEEVLQEVFLQAWREAPRYRTELAPPKGWLLLLARSRALDRLKSEAARRRREEAVGRQQAARAVAPVGATRLEGRERRRQVRSALGSLPAEQRQAIELAFFAGLTHSQISARLGLPLGTVKSRVLLGMHKLRQILGAAWTARRASSHPTG
jgi:RNA polymerase sigma-70 factor (ECF subfamily)